MIRLRTALRVMPALWLAVPISVLAGWYSTLLGNSDGYALDATAKGTAALPLVAAFTAGCAAWEGSRLRRADLWAYPSVRSSASIAGSALVPVVLIGSVAMAIAIMVQIALSQAGAPDVRLVLITLLDLVMYSIVGFAAGVLLPYAVAGPLSVVVPLLWLTFVPAMYPVWLRHLTGLFRDCCALQWDLAPQALLASTIVNVSIIAAALLVLGPPRGRRRPLALPTIIIASPHGTGTILVAGMPYAPAVARDTTSLQCRPAGDTVVCLWPEHSEEAAEIAGVAADVSARWAAAGIAVPAEFTEADPETVSAGAAAMVLSASELNRDRIVAALAASLLPAEPECPAGSSGGIAVEYLQAWYWATGGISREVLEAQYNYDPTPFAPVMDVVRQLEAASVEARRDWQARAEQVSQFCDEEWSPGLLRVGG